MNLTDMYCSTVQPAVEIRAIIERLNNDAFMSLREYMGSPDTPELRARIKDTVDACTQPYIEQLSAYDPLLIAQIFAQTNEKHSMPLGWR